MNVLVTLTMAGVDTSVFNLYSNVDNYTTPIASGISKATLLNGYTTSAPNGTTIVRVKSSAGLCTNYSDFVLGARPTTTTTTTASGTTTTTTTVAPTTTTTTTSGGGTTTTTTTNTPTTTTTTTVEPTTTTTTTSGPVTTTTTTTAQYQSPNNTYYTLN